MRRHVARVCARRVRSLVQRWCVQLTCADVSAAAVEACCVRALREVRGRCKRVGGQTDHGESDGGACEGLRCLHLCEPACSRAAEGGERKGDPIR